MTNRSDASGTEASTESPIEARLAAPPPGPPEPDAEPAPTRPSRPAQSDDLMQNKAVVLGILFLATGFLGIPLLWMNRRFSTSERIIWSILVTIWTCFLIGAVVWIVSWSYRRAFG